MHYIGLLDCNNFFVSCERLFRPDLAGKPTIVLSGNDGCVVARSNEVKELGIPMGVPYFKVREDLEKAGCAVFSSNFPLYRDISRRVMAVLRELSPQVEQYSVDEAFFRLDVQDGEVDRALDELALIKRTVEQKIGVPVSVGAAKTKTIAKFAAEKEKRGSGVCFLTGEAWCTECATLSLGEIWGIGGKTTSKMREHGLYTVSDFLTADRSRIERLFGIHGLRMRDELSERSVHHLGEVGGPQKSIMSSRSFAKTTTDQSVVADALSYHVSHAAEELRELSLQATHLRVLALTNRHSDWVLQGGTSEVILDRPTDDTRILLREAHRLLDELYQPAVPYKKAGVVLGGLVSSEVIQGNLFAVPEESEASAVLMQVLDGVNAKFGSETLTLGKQNHKRMWQPNKAYVSPHYTTKWTDIPIVETS